MEIPKTLTITVPPEPRITAELLSNTNCPVAKAVRQQLPEGRISVGGSDVWVDYQNIRYIYSVPGMGDWLSKSVNNVAFGEMTPEVTLTLQLRETWNQETGDLTNG